MKTHLYGLNILFLLFLSFTWSQTVSIRPEATSFSESQSNVITATISEAVENDVKILHQEQ